MPDKTPPFTFFVSKSLPDTIGTPVYQFIVRGEDFRTSPDQLYYSYALVDALIIPDSSHWQPFKKDTAILTPVLQNGTYRFYVRARDAWGNIDPAPRTWKFTVDVTAPTVTINSPKTEEVIAGKAAIVGSAFDASPRRDFQRYQLSYGIGPDPSKVTNWNTVRFEQIKEQEIRNDTLAIWNTEGLPNGSYWLRLSARDRLSHESHDLVKVEVVSASQTVDSRNGSNLSAAGKLDVYIPPNALEKDLQLDIHDCPIQEIAPKDDNPKVTFINICFKIELSYPSPKLIKPATLMLHYSDSLLTGHSEFKLAVYYSKDGKSNWQRLGGSVDIHRNRITTTFKQFGVFGLYEDLSDGVKPGILNVNSQPRVFSPQGTGFSTQTAISFKLGKESNVTIKIYNAAGRLVRVLTENEPMSYGTQVKYWDGKDQSDNYCLSGLHLITIQADDKMVTKTVVVLNK